MRNDQYTVAVPQSVAAGASQRVRDYVDGVVNFSGGGSWTAQLQGKVAGGDWANIGTAATNAAAALVSVPNGVTDIRVNVTAYASGIPSAIYSGFLSRSD